MTAAELAEAMPDVARRFWGEPNPRHSSKKELRWGTNGARTVDVPKGTWFDHEAGQGGGVLDFLKRERVGDPWEWLREHGYGNASNGRANSQHKIVASYDYTDEFGTLLFQVVRLAPKTFRQRRPDGKGGWIWNLEGVTRVLYRLPDLMEALALERRVFVVEGEKDVETPGAPWHRRNLQPWRRRQVEGRLRRSARRRRCRRAARPRQGRTGSCRRGCPLARRQGRARPSPRAARPAGQGRRKRLVRRRRHCRDLQRAGRPGARLDRQRHARPTRFRNTTVASCAAPNSPT